MTSLEIVTFVVQWVLIVTGAAMVLRTKTVLRWVKAMTEEPEDLFMAGFWTLVLGLVVIAISGPAITWGGSAWIVPLFGWLSVIKGGLLVLWPDGYKGMAKMALKNSGLALVEGIIILAIGVWLMMAG